MHAVYLGTPGPDPACPAALYGKTEAVQVHAGESAQSRCSAQQQRAVLIGGHAARTNADAAVTHTIIDLLPAAGIEVSLSYGSDPALVRRIASTIRVGRAARPAALPRLLPIGPTAAQGYFRGDGFDTCSAPAAAAMDRWLASGDRAIGIYIGGVNRACAQSSLTASWITAIRAQGWHYFPLYPGLQAPACWRQGMPPSPRPARPPRARPPPTTRRARPWTWASRREPRSATTWRRMRAAPLEVTTFLSSWDVELHVRGYRAAVYESFSDIGDLVSAAATMTEPDVIYYADWDGHATTTSSYMPARMWTHHQRIHQYLGGHKVTWDGVTMDIDSDQLNIRLGGPAPVLPGLAGFRVAVGQNVSKSAEWFAKAANGTLVHDYQHPVGRPTWSGVQTVGNSPANIASNPAVAADANGDLIVFARTAASQVVHAWQQPTAPGGWQWGGAVGAGVPPGGMISDPGAARRPGGDVEVFMTRSDGTVRTTRETAPNADGSWTPWKGIGGSCAELAGAGDRPRRQAGGVLHHDGANRGGRPLAGRLLARLASGRRQPVRADRATPPW